MTSSVISFLGLKSSSTDSCTSQAGLEIATDIQAAVAIGLWKLWGQILMWWAWAISDIFLTPVIPPATAISGLKKPGFTNSAYSLNSHIPAFLSPTASGKFIFEDKLEI